MHYKFSEASNTEDDVGSFAEKKTYSLPKNSGSLGYSGSHGVDDGPNESPNGMMETITEEKSRQGTHTSEQKN